MERLRPLTQVACLLCSHMGGEPASHLTPSEFVRLYNWLAQRDIPLEILLEPSNEPLLDEIEKQINHGKQKKLTAERMRLLLQRGVQLTMWLERWLNAGMWVLSWYDPEYPPVLRDRLQNKAPVLLYGFGSPALLNQGGLAIVGSRDAGEALLEMTRRVANRCAQEGWNVVSGGARGVDRAAMTGALEEGGTCVAVLAGDLARIATRSSLRDALLADKLCLVSPYHPESGFSVGNAMGRNKVIYALADYALVMAWRQEQGGTWEGAQEALSNKWIPVFAYIGGEAPPDNNNPIISKGALPFLGLTDQPLREQMDQTVASSKPHLHNCPAPSELHEQVDQTTTSSSEKGTPHSKQLALPLQEVIETRHPQ